VKNGDTIYAKIVESTASQKLDMDASILCPITSAVYGTARIVMFSQRIWLLA